MSSSLRLCGALHIKARAPTPAAAPATTSASIVAQALMDASPASHAELFAQLERQPRGRRGAARAGRGR